MRRRECRQRRLDKYFGPARNDIRVKFNLKQLKIVCAKDVMSQGISSIGSVQNEFREYLIQVSAPYTSITRGSLLAVLIPTPETIAAEAQAVTSGTPVSLNIYSKCAVAGYLWVVNVETETETMHAIAPMICKGAADLPGTVLFLSKIKFNFE